jgi:FlaA1/EpsC-like NDP-sugar epimerase
MLLTRKNTPRWVIIIVDLFLSLIALLFAYLIRFDFKANEEQLVLEWEILKRSLAIFIVIRFLVFFFFKIHKGLIRFTSFEDFQRILLAVSLSSGIFFILGLFRYYFLDSYFLFPTSVLIIEYLSCFLLMMGFRFTVKVLYMDSIKPKNHTEKILIYGAGISGLITKRTIEKDVRISYNIVGFLDDNRKLNGTRLQGTGIFHTSKLDKIITKEGITQVIIAIQNPDKNNSKKVVEICLQHNVSVKKVPNPKSWINGEFSTKQIGKVKIEDLLGRKPILLEEEKISKELNGKVIMVTGAAGSIGSGMVLQIAKFKPKLIVMLDQAESPLYDLQHELYTQYPTLNFEIVIGDVRNPKRMERVFDFFRPAYVFHAAAYKHVPLMENNPSEAILTNVKGSKNLVDMALTYNVEKFVMISTDKAVNPTNVMGASKRIAEIYAQAANNKGTTKFITTRFGNVLGSNGSVIPLFQKQIDQGGPITLTDPRITRFFMTIPEACQLVLEAGTMGEGGEIFVFDMGKSVKIIDLAKKMIQLNGLEIGKDIEIKVTGLRPGEKLYEELLAKEENTFPTYHPQILKAKIREQGQETIALIDELICLFETQQNDKIVHKMKQIVPEYISNNSIFEKLDQSK